MWCWWATHAAITLYELSTSARIEVDASTYLVQSPILGRIVNSNLRVGHTVRRGDVLVELDAAPEELNFREEQVRTAGIDPELARLRAEVEAEERARTEERRGAGLSADEAAGRMRAAEADVRYADAELARAEALFAQRLIAQRDVEKARLDAERRRADAAMLESAAHGVPQQQITRERERDVRIERLRAQIAGLDAERRTLAASVERLRYEIERRRIRAPIDGIIGESAILRPGSVVDEGTQVASIVASGRLIVAAQFPPSAALGRILPGQFGILRLDGFPWSEFGTVSATVAHVAREPRDGSVRVELTIDSRSTFSGKLEHGMPGALEMTVERITPLALLLRTAGQALTAPQSLGAAQ
jgi:membrane fusion protein (multidrug efflux system)